MNVWIPLILLSTFGTSSSDCTDILLKTACLKNCSCHWCDSKNFQNATGICLQEKDVCPHGTDNLSCLPSDANISMIMTIILIVFLICCVLSLISYMGYLYYERKCGRYKYYEYTNL